MAKKCHEKLVIYEAFVEGRRGAFPAIGLSEDELLALMKQHWLKTASAANYSIKKRKVTLRVIDGIREQKTSQEAVAWTCPICHGTHSETIEFSTGNRKVTHCDGGRATLFLLTWEEVPEHQQD